jgi:hypothetical protein
LYDVSFEFFSFFESIHYVEVTLFKLPSKDSPIMSFALNEIWVGRVGTGTRPSDGLNNTDGVELWSR